MGGVEGAWKRVAVRMAAKGIRIFMLGVSLNVLIDSFETYVPRTYSRYQALGERRSSMKIKLGRNRYQFLSNAWYW